MYKVLRIWLTILLLVSFAARADEFDSDGVKIHYVVVGRGDPVIRIHGLLASAQINWEWPGITPDLAKNHRVIALDCRGHGLSDKPISETQYGVKMVDDVVRLMDHLNLQQADVVGYSMGGMITLKLMVLHPERVRSAIIGGMGWMRDGNPFPGNTNASQNAIVACMHGFKELAVSADDVRSIKIPFMVIIGGSDPLRQVFVEPLRKLRPDVPVKVVEGAGHLNCVFRPEFKQAIKTFLSHSPTNHPAESDGLHSM
jgi:pimeloyl-ACP methyl ester carboxylesterase